VEPWIGMIAASVLGVFVVGLAPEDLTPNWHYPRVAANFLFCNVALPCAASPRCAGGHHHPSLDLSLLAGLAGLVCVATQPISASALARGNGRVASKRRGTEGASTASAKNMITRG
jgi:hypothetical protein